MTYFNDMDWFATPTEYGDDSPQHDDCDCPECEPDVE